MPVETGPILAFALPFHIIENTMTLRSSVSPASLRAARQTTRFAAVTTLGCAAAVALGCSASDATGPSRSGSTQGNTGEPSATPAESLPPGVTATTNDMGDTVYMDAEGNVIPTMMGPGGGTTITDPNTGNPVTITQPSTAPGNAPTPTGTDEQMLIPPGDDDVLVDGPAPPPMDGSLVEGMVCNSAEVMYQPVIPTVMLLIDRSTSMFASSLANGDSPPVGSYPDRWEALRAAVDLLAPYSSEVQFGVMTYTGYNPERVPLDACPETQGQEIPVALDNFAQIQAALPPSAEAIPAQKSETPTAEGIAAATSALAAVATDGPKYIVLITDGIPEMCGVFDRGVFCGADPTIAAVQAAYALGIQTLVIGIGFDGSAGDDSKAAQYVLNGAAHAGQGLEVPPPLDEQHLGQFKPCLQIEAPLRGMTVPDDFWNEENWRNVAAGVYGATGTAFTDTLYLLPGDTQLGEQLSQVVAGVRSCSFEMADNIIRDQANKGAVQLTMVDGTTQTLAYGDANGWTLDATRDDLVVVQGTACTQVQDDEQVQAVKIEFPCEVRIPKAR